MTVWQTFIMELFMMDMYSYRNGIWETMFIWCDMPEYHMWIEADNDNDQVFLYPPV